MSVPDKIWVTERNGTIIIGNNRESYTKREWSETVLPDVAKIIGAKQYLEATPAREHAEELVEALRNMAYLQNGGPSTGIDAMKKLGAANALLSKLDK